MTRLCFTADLHVDSYGSRIDPATGLNARLVDHLSTLRFVASDARERGADALVVAGDFTERKHVNTWLAGKIGEQLLAGPERQLLLVGNHDGSIAGESIVTVLARMQPAWEAFARPGVTVVADVAIAAIPHLDARWLRTQPGFETAPPHEVNRVLAEQYLVLARALFAEASEAAPRRILVVHQGLSGGRMSETQAAFLGDRSLVVDSAALAAIGWDAIVAGHYHRAQELSTDPLVAYCGSVERVDFAEEHEPKSYLVLDVPKRGRIRWERVPTPARRYVTLHAGQAYTKEDIKGAIVRCLDVDPSEDLAAFRRSLAEAGAFDIHELRRLRVAEPGSERVMAEDLAPEAALESFFAGDPEAETLVARGRRILEEVA